MTLREEIQAKIAGIRAKQLADITAIKSVADGKVAVLTTFLASGDDFLGKDIDAIQMHLDEVNQLVRGK